MFWQWLNFIGFITLFGVMISAFLKAWRIHTNKFLIIWLQIMLYEARFLAVWFLIWVNAHIFFDWYHQPLYYWVMNFWVMLYLYAIWIEPNLLQIQQQTIQLGMDQPVKLIVISDLHIGIFSGKTSQLQKIVTTINQLEADAVLIAGDWLYHADQNFSQKLSLLKNINKPCYTILSEQDYEYQQTLINDPSSNDKDLIKQLNQANIQVIDGKKIQLQGLEVIGFDITNSANFTQLIKTKRPTVILTHDIKPIQANPNYLANPQNQILVIAGQTHGGQVNLPKLTASIVKAMTGTATLSGLSQMPNYQVWITTGLGMVGLPFRLNCPPKIDVLTIC